MIALKKIAAHLDRYLKIKFVEDSPRAMNGLQVENSGAVKKIGAAVDAARASRTFLVGRAADHRRAFSQNQNRA
jgi:putative NIF3 family GTP cyclohydrolase 1 type 2